VRVVAAKALSFVDRHMHHALAQFVGRIAVTGEAEVFHLFLKQSAEAGDMGIMAREAVSVSYRSMIHPFLKDSPLMTGETVNSRFSDAPGCRKNE
jgi:hypothetical protein